MERQPLAVFELADGRVTILASADVAPNDRLLKQLTDPRLGEPYGVPPSVWHDAVAEMQREMERTVLAHILGSFHVPADLYCGGHEVPDTPTVLNEGDRGSVAEVPYAPPLPPTRLFP